MLVTKNKQWLIIVLALLFTFVAADYLELFPSLDKTNTNDIKKDTPALISSQKENWPTDTINRQLSSDLDTYFLEIKGYTGYQIDETQKSHIVQYIAAFPVYNLPSTVTAEKRKDFDSKRKALIRLWEEHYNKKWPQYKVDLTENNKVLRYKGQNYDAHHIIELSWNGPNQWWNLSPAMYGSQHQNGIHSEGSIASKLFSRE